MEESKVKPDVNCVRAGCHLRETKQLLPVRRKPVESYFEGLKKKQVVKKKIKKTEPKNHIDVIFGSSPPALSEGWISYLTGTPPKEKQQNIMEENLQRRSLEVNIRAYEVLKEYQKQLSSRKQRLAERKYLEQQENLAETWLTLLKRQKEMRDINSESFLPSRRQTVRNNNRIKIFLLSKEFWNDNEVRESSKNDENKVEMRKDKKEVSKTYSSHSFLEGIDDDFYSKLVFVDDEELEPN